MYMSAILQFQFHEGPIKTSFAVSYCKVCSLFQFHEGPIKTARISTFAYAKKRFNSMKVRLKHVPC